MIWMRNKSSVLIALVISWPASCAGAGIRPPYNPARVGLSHHGSRKMPPIPLKFVRICNLNVLNISIYNEKQTFCLLCNRFTNPYI